MRISVWAGQVPFLLRQKHLFCIRQVRFGFAAQILEHLCKCKKAVECTKHEPRENDIGKVSLVLSSVKVAEDSAAAASSPAGEASTGAAAGTSAEGASAASAVSATAAVSA